MYINDVPILAYIITIILGFIIGHSLEYINKKIIDSKEIISKNSIREIIRSFLNFKKDNYINAGIVIILYVIVLVRNGINKEFLDNIELIKAIVLIPVIVSIIRIDLKKKIIPNRLTLFIFETGIFFAFLYSINNLFLTRDYLLAMLVGFAIYGAIALLGKIIAGKDVMGMGDVKLLASLGLYFGIPLTISISIIAFIIAGVINIVKFILNKNKNNKYIPFGPSIGISAILCLLIPENIIISTMLTIFTIGRFKNR